ncbi:transposase, partial [uncultured Shewanella sp.]|uniref:transposase n=1 Tax=uncultured Shewanella sp. TaxID=173975 RepID=UPI00263226B4
PNSGLTALARQYFQALLEEWQQLDTAIKNLEGNIKIQATSNEQVSRLMSIKGVAEITATAAVSFAGNGAQYHNGRHFAANLGLVPREHSSGGKQKLG